MGSDGQKRYGGTCSLYHTMIQRHSQPFLQRNIRRILDGDQTHTHSPTSWKFPTKSMMADVINSYSPILKIHPQMLFKKDTEFVAKEEYSEDPPWLPPPNSVRFKGSISCCISEQRDDEDIRTIFADTRSVILTSMTDSNGNTALSIELEKPFLIGFGSLLVTRHAGFSSNGTVRWKKDAFPRLALRIGINCYNSEDAMQLVYGIDPDFEADHEISAPETELRAHWKHLPDCPVRDLTLRRYDIKKSATAARMKSRKLRHTLSASIFWTSIPQETPLAKYNLSVNDTTTKDGKLTLPLEMEKPRNIMIVYAFPRKTKRAMLRMTNFSCVLCAPRLPFMTFDELHFHYLTSHDHFSFKVAKKNPQSGSPVFERTLYLDLAEAKYERASNSVSDDREFHWIKPEEPFVLQEYLMAGGINTWASEKLSILKKSKLSSVTFNLEKSRSPNSTGSKQSKAHVPPLAHDQIPGEVQALHTRKRKRYKVPKIPRVVLRRTTTKRRVEAGEMLSESDDDSEQFRLWMKQMKQPHSDLSESAKEFVTLFDEHVQHEDIWGDRFIGDTLVRFVRKNVDRLSSPHMLAEFRIKTDQMKTRGLLNDNFARYCIEFLQMYTARNGHASQEDRNGHVGSNRVVDDSDAEAGAEVSPAMSRQFLPNEVDTVMEDYTDSQHPEACLCGKKTFGVRGIITCASHTCPHGQKQFHFGCVGIRSRLLGWLCPDCLASRIDNQ